MKLLIILTLLLSNSAFAEIQTPGSAWDSYGFSPVEKDNKVNYFHIDQGIIVGHVKGLEIKPYVAANLAKDSQGLLWDNKKEYEVGVKLTKKYDNGIVDFGLAYGSEHQKSISKSATIISNNGWFGYKSFNRDDTPGSLWWTIGNISPFEKDNIIGLARIDQGLNLKQIKTITISSQYWAQGGIDSKGDSWNNRFKHGLGIRALMPISNVSFQLTGGYECIDSFINHCGPTIYLDLWSGWNKIGGL